jgi:hypothetical protein
VSAATREWHVLNLGAGVQSTALYLMFMEGILTPNIDAAIFADTQDEPHEVYRHLEWLESLGGPPIIRTSKGKLSSDLIKGENSTGQRWVSIPAFTQNELIDEKEGRLRRQCSKEYKIIPIRQAVRRDVLHLSPRQGIPKGTVVHQYMGISMDESGRASRIRKAKMPKYLIPEFPLIEKLFMARHQCEKFLESRVPHRTPKSACRYCPFHDDATWLQIKSDPAEWAQAVEVDESLRSSAVTSNRRRQNTQPMFLHRSLKPLVEISFDAVAKQQQSWLGFAKECLGVCGV